MNLKTEFKNGAKIFFVEKELGEENSKINSQNKFLELKQAIFLKKINNFDGKEIEIWINQPFYGNFEINYQDSDFFENFSLPQNATERQKHNLKGFITTTLLIKNNQILTSATQDTSEHKDVDKNGFCYRERLKNQNKIQSGQGYQLCEGCNNQNHSEVLAIQKFLQDNPKENLQNSTAYLYGHWWSCSNCSQKMLDYEIKELVICKKWTENFLAI